MGSSITRMRYCYGAGQWAISTCCCSAMVTSSHGRWRKLGAESVDDSFCDCADHLFLRWTSPPRDSLASAKKDIFRYRQVRRELHLLINQRDACAKCIFGTAE